MSRCCSANDRLDWAIMWVSGPKVPGGHTSRGDQAATRLCIPGPDFHFHLCLKWSKWWSLSGQGSPTSFPSGATFTKIKNSNFSWGLTKWYEHPQLRFWTKTSPTVLLLYGEKWCSNATMSYLIQTLSSISLHPFLFTLWRNTWNGAFASVSCTELLHCYC